MIYAIIGLPGYGKSYYAVSLIKKFLEKGVDVYINILVDEKKLNLRRNGKKELGKLYKWTSLAQFRFVQNGIVIIDEAASYFEARNWARFDIEDRIKFQQHRKQKLDIYVIAQSFSRIEVSIRQLVNFVFEMRKWSLFGQTIFWCRKYIPEDIDLKTRKTLGTKVLRLQKKVYGAYDTYEQINLVRPPVENKFKRMNEFFASEPGLPGSEAQPERG